MTRPSLARGTGWFAFIVETASYQIPAKTTQTGSWTEFRETDIGQLKIEQPGDQTVKVRPKDAASWKAINLRLIKLSPAS